MNINRLYQQKALFFPESSNCMRLKNTFTMQRQNDQKALMIRVFHLNSSVNKMLGNSTIPPCEKLVIECTNLILVLLLDTPAYSLILFLITELSGGGKSSRQKFFSEKLSIARITITNSFGKLKARFKGQRSMNFIDMDIDRNTQPKVISCYFAVHSYCN